MNQPIPHTLLTRLHLHIATMAPHQKSREAGKLLIDAAHRIERLEKGLQRIRDLHYSGNQHHSAWIARDTLENR